MDQPVQILHRSILNRQLQEQHHVQYLDPSEDMMGVLIMSMEVNDVNEVIRVQKVLIILMEVYDINEVTRVQTSAHHFNGSAWCQ